MIKEEFANKEVILKSDVFPGMQVIKGSTTSGHYAISMEIPNDSLMGPAKVADRIKFAGATTDKKVKELIYLLTKILEEEIKL